MSVLPHDPFLAIKEDVRAAIEAGYAVKTIWANMHESKKIEFGYDAFLNYVNRKLRPPKVEQQTPLTELSPATADEGIKSTPDAKKPVAKPGTLPGFTYNPIPNLEELI